MFFLKNTLYWQFKSPTAVCNEAPNPTSFVEVKLVISFCEGIVVFPITAGQTVLTLCLCVQNMLKHWPHTCVHARPCTVSLCPVTNEHKKPSWTYIAVLRKYLFDYKVYMFPLKICISQMGIYILKIHQSNWDFGLYDIYIYIWSSKSHIWTSKNKNIFPASLLVVGIRKYYSILLHRAFSAGHFDWFGRFVPPNGILTCTICNLLWWLMCQHVVIIVMWFVTSSIPLFMPMCLILHVSTHALCTSKYVAQAICVN